MIGLEEWALPGGFVQREEDIDKAAVRVLGERTGLDKIFLQQFHLFGAMDRNPKDSYKPLRERNFIPEEAYGFLESRFLSLGYYALVEYSEVEQPKPDVFSDSCEWKSLADLPPLILDHAQIVQKAYEKVRLDLRHQPIGKNLLPQRFTMPELQALYETLLNRKLDRRNFQRKMLSYGILVRTEERRKGGAHKAPYLYEFEEETYQQALAEGLGGGW